MTSFRPQVVWEVDPPSAASPPPNGSPLIRHSTDRMANQLDTVRGLATSVLVPDNHTGKATVSSIAVARRVQEAGIDAVACLNARDRNLLGLRRDLLTCDYEGIDDVLLVYGDQPRQGSRAADLTVGRMLDECRAQVPHLRVGVTTRLTRVPRWKLDADRLFVQVSYDLDALLAWRRTITFDGPVIPAVMTVPSVAMAQRLAARIPELTVPDCWLKAIAADAGAGARLAAGLAARILATGQFEGVHVVSGRYPQATADHLTALTPTPPPEAHPETNPETRSAFDDRHRQPRLSSNGSRPRAEVGA